MGSVSSAGGARSRPVSVVFGGAISKARPSRGGFAGGVIWTGAGVPVRAGASRGGGGCANDRVGGGGGLGAP